MPAFCIYLISIYGFDNCDVHLGCFSLFTLFCTYVLVWSVLGYIGFVLTRKSSKEEYFPYKNVALLGFIIGLSHFLVQINIGYFLIMLPLPVLLSWLGGLWLYRLKEK
jgi:preprotein translocase subunit Sss1